MRGCFPVYGRLLYWLTAFGFAATGCQGVGDLGGSLASASPPKEKGPKTLFKWAICEEKDKKDEKENGEEEDTKDNKNTQDSKSTDSECGEYDNGKPSDEEQEEKGGRRDGDTKRQLDDGSKPQQNGKDKKKASPGRENGKKSGNKQDDEKEEDDDEDDDEIQTDRPDFTEASTTVGMGRIQLETGYTFVRDRSQGTRLSAHSFPEALLRIGMFAEWFELRIGQNFGVENVTMPDGSVERASGAFDLYLGTKLALTEQKKCLPEMALVLQMTVPSGSRDFSADEVLPGMNLLYGWDVVKDCVSVGGSTQANRTDGIQVLPVFSGVEDLAGPTDVEARHSYCFASVQSGSRLRSG